MSDDLQFEATRRRVEESIQALFSADPTYPDLDACRRASDLCDCEHPEVRAKARGLAEGAPGDVEAAVRIYAFVREDITFGFDTWVTPASETLAKGYGMCTNKAILATTLCRAAGIPAAFGLVLTKTLELKPFLHGQTGEDALRTYVELFGDRMVHIFTMVHLDGRWLEADASADSRTLKNLLKAHIFFPQVLRMWDGKSDHGIHPRLCYQDRKVVRVRAELDEGIRALCPFDEHMGTLRVALEERVEAQAR